MTEYRTLPVDEAVTWIRAWTDHTWPMSLQEAFTIRDTLGWEPLPNEPEFFTTPLSINEHWGGTFPQVTNSESKESILNFPQCPVLRKMNRRPRCQLQPTLSMPPLWSSFGGQAGQETASTHHPNFAGHYLTGSPSQSFSQLHSSASISTHLGEPKSRRTTTRQWRTMTDFHTLPVDEALAWIRAWTDHTWPITLQQAFAIRDALGWKPSPQEPRYFTTKLSINGRENGIISRSNEFGIKGLTFNLSSFPYPNNKQSTQIASID